MFLGENNLTEGLLSSAPGHAGALAVSACPVCLPLQVMALPGQGGSSGRSEPTRPLTPEPGALATGRVIRPAFTGFGMESFSQNCGYIQG